jgi:hypothetical protein
MVHGCRSSTASGGFVVAGQRYEVLVRGSFGAELSAALEGFDIQTDDAGLTRVTGEVQDQPGLLGLLSAFDDLHIEVISVNPASVASEVSPSRGDAAPASDH